MNFKSILRHLRGSTVGYLALAAFLLGSGASCPPGGGEGPGPIHKNGIYYTNAATFGSPTETQGEEFTVPITVDPLAPSENGLTVVVTPTPISGITFTPASRTVKLPSGNDSLDVTFTAKVAVNKLAGDYPLVFSRTSGANITPPSVQTTLHVVDNLVRGTISPNEYTIAPGASRVFQAGVLPRGDTEGPIELTADYNSSKFTVSPQNFTVNLTPHATTAVLQPITLSALSTATASDNGFLRIRQHGRIIAEAYVQVGTSTGTPTFTFSATPLNVEVGFNEVSAQSVVFTVTSVNGFSGPIKITWNVDAGAQPSPNDNNFIVNVAPGAPATFSRKFYSFVTHTVPVPVEFSATDNPFTTTRTVTVNVKHP